MIWFVLGIAFTLWSLFLVIMGVCFSKEECYSCSRKGPVDPSLPHAHSEEECAKAVGYRDCPVCLATDRADRLRELRGLEDRIREAVARWLMPNERGTVPGYGGEYPNGDPWLPETWSDGHDYQHAALDIWEVVNKKP